MASAALFSALPTSVQSMLSPKKCTRNRSRPKRISVIKYSPDSMSSAAPSLDRMSPLSPSQPPSPRVPSPSSPRTRKVKVAGTEVPEDLYKSLLKAGEQARKRGQHRQVLVEDPLACTEPGLQDEPVRHLVLMKPQTRKQESIRVTL
mmetsp:Transcript_21312/g.49489  ORF Transcript_21312/g.49489 Transcript_21312/m.49489 type:complete len:147 (-) Transcript_21312:216-656(-)|eukprot:CAMPEP_0178455598 /NCGR_PEP_ID=MMETSP0689_2-20121128/45997_1 /TAXON_ID=160604 /ORGANISM="Amphidinium massartii, Strain CS-259" /LENGTH=146 /DNA_ID=CAMNT_0020081649 /DNA_START=90 /DNA_END=530 /DNA_ORIENTATION=-